MLLPALTPMQAEVVRVLDEARKAGTPVMSHRAILASMRIAPNRLSDAFRGTDPRRVLIEKVGKDSYRLRV